MAERWSFLWDESDEAPIFSKYFQHLRQDLNSEFSQANVARGKLIILTKCRQSEECPGEVKYRNPTKNKSKWRRSIRFESENEDLSVSKSSEDLLEEPKKPKKYELWKRASFRATERPRTQQRERSVSTMERSRSFRSSEERPKMERVSHPWALSSDVSQSAPKAHGGFMDSFRSSLMRSKSNDNFSRRFSRAKSQRLSHIKEFWQKQQEKLNEKLRIPSPEARAVHRVGADGSLSREEPPPLPQPSIHPPVCIHHVHTQVLYSGTTVWTGYQDKSGHPIVLIFCKHPAWQMEQFTSSELAKLLLYYHTIPHASPSSSASPSSMTIIVEARSTTLPVINLLLETLYTVEASSPGAIHIVHVLADRLAQMLLFKSPVFRPQVDLKINLLMGVDAVFSTVERSKLPPQLGGTAHCNHQHWVQFRLKLEPFVSNCRSAAEFLVGVMGELTSLEALPGTTEECRTALERHEALVRRALDDPVLMALQNAGSASIEQLADEARAVGEPEDYRASLRVARALFQQVHEAMLRLVRLADKRLHKLERCLHLREFEEYSSQAINWLCGEGEEQLARHQDVADNLKAIRVQQKNFDKFYFTAMTHIDKGNDMLEEASLLGQSGEDTSGIRDIAKELRSRLKHFTERLEDQREQIENTAKCYHLLDKAYEWALDAMKFVSTLRIEKDMSSSQLSDLLRRLELYLRDHPPLQADLFDTMLKLAEKLENYKLHEQCKVAHSRCLETDHLLRVRQSSLRKAKHQLDLEHRSRPNSIHGMAMPPHYMVDSPLWESSNCSSAVGPPSSALRRRSYAGKPSSPVYSPAAAAFRDHLRDMNLSEYEEYLFSEGLITEDMSDRIVANLPKGLSSSTLRNSKESLRESQENLSTDHEQKSSSLPRDMTLPGNKSPTNKSPKSSSGLSWVQTTLNKHNKPHRKMMRKSASMVLPDSTMDSMLGRTDKARNIKSLSMVTGSSDSLPSLPEEENMTTATATTTTSSSSSSQTSQSGASPDGAGGRGLGRTGGGATEEEEEQHGWSPVPVNTHLMFSRPVHHQSMADIRTAEVDIKRRRTLAHIMQEMLHTERDYVRSLQFIIDNYIPEILQEDVPEVLRGKRNVIFGNLEKIYEFHSQSFLETLEGCEANPFLVGHCFLNHETEFYLYAMYNKNKPKADALLAEYGAEFFKSKQHKLGDKMDLASYLLKPVQRMGKYALLLKQIIHECPETEPEYADLKQAYDNIKFQLRHGNDLLAMDSLIGCDVNLAEQGMLLRQDAFIVWQGRKKSLRHAFLFEDMVVFAKTKRSSTGHDIYVYKSSIKTSDMGLTENVAGSNYRFELWFRKRTMGEAYILQAPSTDVKASWAREISRLLWKQAIKNRASRMAEMARMGIGTKPCMDLKTSDDNINDRLINCNISNKSPRTRNSIAVSSMDHLKSPGKRPHSLISLSSSSSSSSTQSSALTRMVESPYENSPTMAYIPRSATLDSNESGIVSDMSTHSLLPCQEDACTQTTLKRPQKKPLPLDDPVPQHNGVETIGPGGNQSFTCTTIETVLHLENNGESGNSHLVSTNV